MPPPPSQSPLLSDCNSFRSSFDYINLVSFLITLYKTKQYNFFRCLTSIFTHIVCYLVEQWVICFYFNSRWHFHIFKTAKLKITRHISHVKYIYLLFYVSFTYLNYSFYLSLDINLLKSRIRTYFEALKSIEVRFNGEKMLFNLFLTIFKEIIISLFYFYDEINFVAIEFKYKYTLVQKAIYLCLVGGVEIQVSYGEF